MYILAHRDASFQVQECTYICRENTIYSKIFIYFLANSDLYPTKQGSISNKSSCCIIFCTLYIFVKVKQSHYRPGQVQSVLR